VQSLVNGFLLKTVMPYYCFFIILLFVSTEAVFCSRVWFSLRPQFFRFVSLLIKIHQMTNFVAVIGSHILTVNADFAVNLKEWLSFKGDSVHKSISVITLYVVRLLLSYPCIHNKVNGNAPINGRGKQNQKRVRIADRLTFIRTTIHMLFQISNLFLYIL